MNITFNESPHQDIEKEFSIEFEKSLIIFGKPPLNDGAISNAIHITGITPKAYIQLGISLSFIYKSMSI